ncbi:Gprotein-likeprotein coupled receptor 151-like [Podarcis lilfordi]|uniref:Gprotein-likeprotein coupled receptor 151-like n=1 Tax=Podarcis lilfordi TaxID=74358 RepID=A0AA35KX15_9SAUR|nr:Gprotein-likeprotein coupled receptor 151-like [Podarcis lilfordi]
MNSSQAVFFAGGPQWWRAGSAVLPLLLAGLCLASLAGNLLLLTVLIHELRRGKISPANALVLNLCSADLILVVCCLPTRIATYSRRSWVFGSFVCKATDWLLHGCLVAKSLTWAAVGQARYKHVVSSSSSSSSSSSKCLGLSWRRLAGLLASAWLAALLLPLPHLLFTYLEAGGAPGGLLYCVFRSPPYAANFMDVFSKVYPLIAYLAPAGFTFSCYWRALRAQRGGRRNRLAKPGSPQSKKVTWVLLGLTLLFQATWLPAWVAWLWERHSGGGPQPPPALIFAAEVLIFLDGALNPGVFLATSGEFREGLRSLRRGLSCRGDEARRPRSEETPQSLQDLKEEEDREAAAAQEKVLPDVEHFWKDRRNTVAGEESDPVPWEHQGDP